MGRRILLVEGKDDEHVFKAIFGQYQLQHLDIKEHGGYATLLEAVPLRLIESDVSALGVVIDADSDASSRWESLRNNLIFAGYSGVPQELPCNGLVIEAPADKILPRFGTWIMPDNVIPGILEHFLETLVPPNDELYSLVTRTVDTIPNHLRRFRSVDLPKAKIHTFLAWQDEPGKPLGQSITRHVLQAHSPSCEQIVAWLRRLYSL